MDGVDLHLHSTFSDGRHTPQEIVEMAAARAMGYIALSDHDTVDGINPALAAARRYPGLKIIPAVEISTDTADGEVHILGYFIDHTQPELQKNLVWFRASRERRARGMVAKLQEMGINISWEKVKQRACDGAIGRPHLAQEMIAAGYISKFAEAFDKYIGYAQPAYVSREKVTPAQAVAMITSADGLPALAHPFTVADPETLIQELAKSGLAALEAHYNGYDREQRAALLEMAQRHGLVATGGSDFHGIDDKETKLGDAGVPLSAALGLIELAKRRRLKAAARLAE